MKIQNALETAKDCGLTTVGEAILHIETHALSLFSDPERELAELKDTWDWIKTHRRTPDGAHSIDENTEIALMLGYHIAEDLTDYRIYQQALVHPYFAKKLADE